jgi:hypothetical protein
MAPDKPPLPVPILLLVTIHNSNWPLNCLMCLLKTKLMDWCHHLQCSRTVLYKRQHLQIPLHLPANWWKKFTMGYGNVSIALSFHMESLPVDLTREVIVGRQLSVKIDLGACYDSTNVTYVKQNPHVTNEILL